MKKLTVIESPFKATSEFSRNSNITYARKCMKDSIKRGEAPFASHLLYTQSGILNDDIPSERNNGIQCGFVWGMKADQVAVYIDHGISQSMLDGVKNAQKGSKKIRVRTILSASVPITSLRIRSDRVTWKIAIHNNRVINYYPKTNAWMKNMHVTELLEWAFRKELPVTIKEPQKTKPQIV